MFTQETLLSMHSSEYTQSVKLYMRVIYPKVGYWNLSCLIFLSKDIHSIYFSSCVILLIILINLKVRLKGDSPVGRSACTNMSIWVWILSTHIRYWICYRCHIPSTRGQRQADPEFSVASQLSLTSKRPSQGKAENEIPEVIFLDVIGHVHVIPYVEIGDLLCFLISLLSSDFPLVTVDYLYSGCKWHYPAANCEQLSLWIFFFPPWLDWEDEIRQCSGL